MNIYDLIYVMGNMNFDIIVQNDANLDNDKEGVVFEGEVSDFMMTDLYDRIQDLEVSDLYTLADGRMYICYTDEEE